jgi:hypothetical protein
VIVFSRNSLLARLVPNTAATRRANPVLAIPSCSPPGVASDGIAIAEPVPAFAVSRTARSAVIPTAAAKNPSVLRVVRNFNSSTRTAVIMPVPLCQRFAAGTPLRDSRPAS